jgi:hypothetical protein
MSRRTPLLLFIVVLAALSSCTQNSEPEERTSVLDGLRRVKLDSWQEHDFADRALADANAMKRLAAAANRLSAGIRADRPLFDRPGDAPLSADERARALALFADVLDHCHAFDGLVRFHLDAWKMRPLPTNPQRVRHFDLGYLAYLEKLALALALVEQGINKPQFEKLYDEGSPAWGIPAGAWAKLKWNVVHVEDVAKIVGAHSLRRVMTNAEAALRAGEAGRAWSFVHERIDERFSAVRTVLATRAVTQFGGNGIDIGVDVAHAAWFPVQAETAEWMGDTKIKRRDSMLISEAQVKQASALSEPGDVIVERRNWYLSNIGLPGFWPHAALWVGSHDELTAWARDPAIETAFHGSFVEHLARRFPTAWAAYLAPEHDGSPRRLIEAVSEGVVFHAAEESIRADYVAALRPLRSKLEKARAIERAFFYFGRPYDFDFDFYTDESLVCSELVMKSWEPRADLPSGVRLGLERVVGRMTLGPNSIVRAFDQQAGTPEAQLAFAWFLDASERDGRAFFSDEAALRASWRRPKWDLAQR